MTFFKYTYLNIFEYIYISKDNNINIKTYLNIYIYIDI